MGVGIGLGIGLGLGLGSGLGSGFGLEWPQSRLELRLCGIDGGEVHTRTLPRLLQQPRLHARLVGVGVRVRVRARARVRVKARVRVRVRARARGRGRGRGRVRARGRVRGRVTSISTAEPSQRVKYSGLPSTAAAETAAAPPASFWLAARFHSQNLTIRSSPVPSWP